jgi:hypothetical protein
LAAVQENGEAIEYIKIQFVCYTNSSPSEDDICPICQDGESIDNQWCELNKCKHKFHIECIDGWLLKQRTCPKCRGCLI